MIKKILRGVEYVVSLPKSFYASWRLCSFKHAFKLPVMCRYNVRLLNLRGALVGGANY